MDKLENKKLAIIGIGHLGRAIYKGLINSGFKKENIILSNSSKNNKKAVLQANWILLCVKPLLVHQVVSEIKNYLKDKLLISAAAVVSIGTIAKHTRNKKQKIIRIMPNINVVFNQGVIGFYANRFVSGKDKKQLRLLLSRLGTVIKTKDERHLDSLTLISACGPGYFAYLMQNVEKITKSYGFSADESQKITLQTLLGTVTHLLKTNMSTKALVESVATKGGITGEIIKILDQENFPDIIRLALDGGFKKIGLLTEKLTL